METINQYKLIWPDSLLEKIYDVSPEGGDLIARWLTLLNETCVAYAIGGAFAVHAYTGIWRNTKDFDVFLAPRDLKKVLNRLNDAYFHPDIRDTCWLAKVESTPFNLDIIFGFRNGQARLDSDWFRYSRRIKVMDVETAIFSPEELIASKVYVVKRYRFDGADIAHLLRETSGNLDWERLVSRMGENRGLLLWHLFHFAFVYPGHIENIPRDLLVRLFGEVLERGEKMRNSRLCNGSLLDPPSFEIDYTSLGYEGLHKAQPLVDYKGDVL